jgi:UDP-glucose 4-epimerase
MHLLVTGGAGYIGSIVVERAIEAGHRVTAVDTLAEGHAGAVHPAARFVLGDVGDVETLDTLLTADPIDAVLHLAAETTIDASMTDPLRYFQNNTSATVTLLDAMRRHGVMRIVFSSTAAVYGEPDTTPITEDHPVRPINAYGESKLSCERAIAWCCRAYGMRAVAFRYFNAAGASAERGEAHRHESHLIPLVFHACVNRTAVALHGTDYPTRDGSCVRDFVHVLDIADAHLLALSKLDRQPFAALNLGTGHGYTVREVIDQARRITGRDVEVADGPRRPGDPAALVADGHRAGDRLGWTPRRSSLDEILQSAWRWMLAHPDAYGD